MNKFCLLFFSVALLMSMICSKEIFIEFEDSEIEKELLRYFSDVNNALFLDIGAFDGIYASNTLNLRLMGWNGVNVDASPTRLARFGLVRPGEVNIFSAIGDKDTYLTLYDPKDDSTGTVSKKVMEEQISRSKTIMNEVKVPSMDMKSLCERFLYQKPALLSLDIEGYGSMALMGNDWENQRCRPDLIIAEDNNLSAVSGLPLPKDVLIPKGYKLLEQRLGYNQVFIETAKYDEYMQKRKNGEKVLTQKEFVSWKQIVQNLEKHFNIKFYYHYEPTTFGVFFSFAEKGQPLSLQALNARSNALGKEANALNRPIIVYNFNPHLAHIITPHDNYTLDIFETNGNSYFVINVQNDPSYSVYIFDHHYEPALQLSDLKIINPFSKSQVAGVSAVEALRQQKENEKFRESVSDGMQRLQTLIFLCLVVLIVGAGFLYNKLSNSPASSKSLRLEAAQEENSGEEI